MNTYEAMMFMFGWGCLAPLAAMIAFTIYDSIRDKKEKKKK